MVVEFVHRFGMPMLLDISFEYSITEQNHYNNEMITQIQGTIQRNSDSKYYPDITYTQESRDSLLNRIADIEFNNSFDEALK